MTSEAKKQAQSAAKADADFYWSEYYNNRVARRRTMGGKAKRRITEIDGRTYHYTKGYR